MKLMYPEAVLLKRISEQENACWISFTEIFCDIFSAKFQQTKQSLGPLELKLYLDSCQQDKATQGFPTYLWRFFCQAKYEYSGDPSVIQSIHHQDMQWRR